MKSHKRGFYVKGFIITPHFCISLSPNRPVCSFNFFRTEEVERADWSVRTETYAEMWSDYETFYIKASLVAFHNGDLVFEKEFKEEIQRLKH